MAFEGKLVFRQDPKDEPAEVLLQKIKNESSVQEIAASINQNS